MNRVSYLSALCQLPVFYSKHFSNGHINKSPSLCLEMHHRRWWRLSCKKITSTWKWPETLTFLLNIVPWLCLVVIIVITIFLTITDMIVIKIMINVLPVSIEEEGRDSPRVRHKTFSEESKRYRWSFFNYRRYLGDTGNMFKLTSSLLTTSRSPT